MVSDTSFLLGGVGDEGTFVQVIDLEGNLLDSWQPGFDSEIGLLRHIIVTEDKDYIIFADKIAGQSPSGNYLIQLTMSRLTPDFEVEWIFPFGIVEVVNANIRLWDIQPTSDGNYIAAGQSAKYDAPYARRAGWIFKFSPQGDSIWSHIIDPWIPSPDIYESGQYGGVGELSSGSYVAGGYANTNDRFMWLTKVTADGCLEDFCPEINVISNEAALPIEKAAIKVIPNPVSGVFQVLWPAGFSPTNKPLATLSNIRGQQVWQKKISPNETISVESLPNGIYFLDIQADQKRWVSKIVKQ